MKFALASIWIMSLFWLIPVMALFYIYAFRKKKRLIEMFCKTHLKDKIMPKYHMGRQWLKAFLILISILLMIFALMRPRWGFHWEEIKRVGVDLIVAVDCSQSMLATDVQPDRLERAKREIQDLLKMLDGDRIGLVAFAGTSFVQCPLTLDYGAFRMFLEYLDTDLIPVQGTAIGQAIHECIGCFDRTQKGSKAILLITDGEDHEGDPMGAAAEAKVKGIKIFPIGIGKEGGAPIPLKEGSGFKKDRQGNLILSKLDERTLQKIALETGGRYVRSVTGDLDLEKVYLEGVKSMDQKELASTKKRIWEERFQWFLFLVLIFLFLEQLLPEYGRKRIKRNLGMGILMLFVFASAKPANGRLIPSSKAKEAQNFYESQSYDQALSAFLDAQIDSPEDPVLYYNIANTYYQMNNYEEASKNYQSAATNAKDIDLEQKAYYNLGNAAYRMGKLDEAITWYQKALELKPDDEDAKYNLEFVREEIKRRINQAKEQKENQKKGEDAQEQKKSGSEESSEEQQAETQPGQQQAKEEKSSDMDQTGKAEEDPNRKGDLETGKSTEAKEDREKGAEDQTGKGMKAKAISRDEAERLLQSLDEEGKKGDLKQQIPATGQTMPEKDW